MTQDQKIQLKKKLIEISTPEEFIKFVAEFHGFDLEAMCGPARHRELVDVRAKIVRALKDKWNMTYVSIGRLLNRDHTSILYLYRRPVTNLWKVPENPLDGVCTVEGEKSEEKKEYNLPTSQ